MIYLDEKTEQRALFENLLEQTKTAALNQLRTIDKPNTLSGNEFEILTFENAVLSARGTPFEDKLRHTEDRVFPDIVAAGLFGIEVKATRKDDWTSIGNSISESSRVKDVEKIYMFFGKLGGNPDIKYRNYEDCLRGISVTHNPRYEIDMLMDEENSIFKKMGVNYDDIRTSPNRFKVIRAYYKSQMKKGEGLWWIDDDSESTPTLSPIIKAFKSLDKNTKDLIKAEIFAYFPEVLTSSNMKYERVPAYMASRHGVVSSSLRDQFTASGQVDITFDGQDFRAPHMIGELLELAPLIKKCLEHKNQEQLSDLWRKRIENFTSAEEAWRREIDKNSEHMNMPVKLSALFTDFLEKQRETLG